MRFQRDIYTYAYITKMKIKNPNRAFVEMYLQYN